MKKLLKVLAGAILLTSLGVVASADEMSTLDRNRMLGATAMDWQSANLREWLNSSEENVRYTAIEPSYANEPGFLSSQNFTQSERDAIAVTRHGAGYQSTLSGNVNNTMYLSQRSVAHNDYRFNDKVFILHYTDLVNYIEKNKVLFDHNTKYYSNDIQRTTNKKDKYGYVVNSGYYNSGYYGTSELYTSNLYAVPGRNKLDIAPALSLKPDYVLPGGAVARNLKLGSKVTFGKYNGEPIEWLVINVSDAGYPLLWSDRIIMTKEYDAQGDINPSTSSYINYATYDVDITTGNGQARSWETGTSIDSTTSIKILNESVLSTPTNDTSIKIQIKVTDTKYSIRKLHLPDGSIVYGDYSEFTIPKNGEYTIMAENSQGVLTVTHIITKAINTPAEVNITTNKASSGKWSNKPITVTVSASNNGVYTKTITGNRNMGYGGASASVFPGWMSLGGKRVRITGTLKNAMTDEQASQVDMNVYIRMRMNYIWYDSNRKGHTYPLVKEIKLSDLKAQGEIPIDMIYTMPSNVYENAYFSISLMDSNTQYMKSPYNYWISDFEFEILDKDDLAIEKIFLPDGNVVNSDKTSYVISETGSYTFSAEDNRGKVTSKTIDLAIDMGKPSLDVINTQNGMVKSTVLRINATDDLSGIKSIKLPNGETRSNGAEGQPLSITYNIMQNGSYTFTAEDYAGNTISKTIAVSNVDTTAPTGTATKSPSAWTVGNVLITVNATDNSGGAGMDSITLPDGKTVTGATATYEATSNGTFNFTLKDKVGNSQILSVLIDNIDKVPPTLSVTKETAWKKNSVSIQASAGDSISGIKELILPNGNRINAVTSTYNVSELGVYYFTAIDNAGNSTSAYVIVDNIDKKNPDATISNNQEWNNSSSVPVTITGADN